MSILDCIGIPKSSAPLFTFIYKSIYRVQSAVGGWSFPSMSLPANIYFPLSPHQATSDANGRAYSTFPKSIHDERCTRVG